MGSKSDAHCLTSGSPLARLHHVSALLQLRLAPKRTLPTLRAEPAWPYTLVVRFEWDSDKALRNPRKHRISFAEASTVFGDPLAATIADRGHSKVELRFITLRMSTQSRLLVAASGARDRPTLD